jgi:hypothetical protein
MFGEHESNMVQEKQGSSRIELVVTHSPLAYIYEAFTPTVTINGNKERRPWGEYTYDLAPGTYRISVSYPWLFLRECGRNTVQVTVHPGETKRITYCARLIRYLPGTMKVE